MFIKRTPLRKQIGKKRGGYLQLTYMTTDLSVEERVVMVFGRGQLVNTWGFVS